MYTDKGDEYTIERGEGLRTWACYEALLAERDDLQARLDSASALIEAAEKYRAAAGEGVLFELDIDEIGMSEEHYDAIDELLTIARQQPATPTGQGQDSAGQDSEATV